MPLYDYRCQQCAEVLKDVFRKMEDIPPMHCGKETERLLSPSAVHTFDCERVFDHITGTPMKFNSKRALRDFCREQGKISHYAE